MTQTNNPELQPLAKHIEQHYEGNKSAFAHAFGISRQHLNGYFKAKKPVYVLGGKLVQIIGERQQTTP